MITKGSTANQEEESFWLAKSTHCYNSGERNPRPAADDSTYECLNADSSVVCDRIKATKGAVKQMDDSSVNVDLEDLPIPNLQV